MRNISAAGTCLSQIDEVVRDIRKLCPSRRSLAVLDLGSGTGRFTPALAEAFGGPVYGVEPLHKMRAVAERHKMRAVAESSTYISTAGPKAFRCRR